MNLNQREGGCIQLSWLTVLSTLIVTVIGTLVMISALGNAVAAGPDPIVATVGTHRITRHEMDAKMVQSVSPSQLYDLRRQALDSLIDDYVIDQAAKKAHLTPQQYIIHELPSTKITEVDAKKYYDEHKAQITRPYDQIKTPLLNALRQREERTQVEQFVAKLRSEQNVKVMLEAPHVKVASAGHPSVGGKDAPITIVEFGDFQCPFCRAAEKSLQQVHEKYGDKVRLVYMDFPLGIHTHALDAANAARCAGEQDKFWQYHDALFADQSKLAPADLKVTAAKLGLDAKKFDACFDKTKYQSGIRQDVAQGSSLGVTGTPTFFINGREISGAQRAKNFEDIINDELARVEHPAAQRQASVKQ